ncbi:MAG: hypothetical protein H0U79_02080 [Solirubrobacterales bacterium]|nr:hypothetical protein [Solirubrobacterales bacterium]
MLTDATSANPATASGMPSNATVLGASPRAAETATGISTPAAETGATHRRRTGFEGAIEEEQRERAGCRAPPRPQMNPSSANGCPDRPAAAPSASSPTTCDQIAMSTVGRRRASTPA